jgi:acetolactate synthase regulatory subunit
MLVIPATAPLERLCHISLVCVDRPDLPARVTATCARRGGVVVALAFARGRPHGRAELEVTVDVGERHRQVLLKRLAGLVDVVEVTCHDRWRSRVPAG